MKSPALESVLLADLTEMFFQHNPGDGTPSSKETAFGECPRRIKF